MDYVRGYDVSHHQDDVTTPEVIDFSVAKDNLLEFVIFRASNGLTMDRTFLVNRVNSKKAGLIRGIYHFLVWNINPELQAQFFWHLVKDDPGELPLVCDFEVNPGLATPSNAKDILYRFLVEIERLSGRTPAIYTGTYFWLEHGSQEPVWGRYKLWCASYTTQSYMEKNIKQMMTPWTTWTFWQFTAKGDGKRLGVESNGLDMNYFNGTKDELMKLVKTPNDEPLTNEQLMKLLEKTETVQALSDQIGQAIDDIEVSIVNLKEYLKQ